MALSHRTSILWRDGRNNDRPVRYLNPGSPNLYSGAAPNEQSGAGIRAGLTVTTAVVDGISLRQ